MVLSEALTDACLPPDNKYLLSHESRFSGNISSHSLSSPKKEKPAFSGEIHLAYVSHSDNILFLHHAQGSVCVKLKS